MGNELAFYIFDYPAEKELDVRERTEFMIARLEKQHGLRVLGINLLDLVMNHLQERQLLDHCFALEESKGTKELYKALKAPLKSETIVGLFKAIFTSAQYDVVLIYGVGSVWPFVRSHSLLNNLQPVVGNTPVIMFYPGTYDGQALKLFGKLKSDNYYRAFRLIP